MTAEPAEGRERLTTIEATCRLCWHLWNGEGVSTAQAAELIGYTHDGAYKMLCSISRYVPITQDGKGVWQMEYLLRED